MFYSTELTSAEWMNCELILIVLIDSYSAEISRNYMSVYFSILYKNFFSELEYP